MLLKYIKDALVFSKSVEAGIILTYHNEVCFVASGFALPSGNVNQEMLTTINVRFWQIKTFCCY